jgi:hypothetical protein
MEILNTDIFYPPGASTSSSNYVTINTGAVGAGGSGGTAYSYGLHGTGYFDMNSSQKEHGVIRADRDVIIDGRSMRDFMESMEKRMAILVPDPKKLAHFQSLQKAYAHYKTLEALCELPTEPKDA